MTDSLDDVTYLVAQAEAWASDVRAIMKPLANLPNERTERLIVVTNVLRAIAVKIHRLGGGSNPVSTTRSVPEVAALSPYRAAMYVQHLIRFNLVVTVYRCGVSGFHWMPEGKKPTLMEACDLVGEVVGMSGRTIKDSYDIIRKSEPMLYIERTSGELGLDPNLEETKASLPQQRGAPSAASF